LLNGKVQVSKYCQGELVEPDAICNKLSFNLTRLRQAQADITIIFGVGFN
jgi:hypothetical protein